MPLRLKLKRKQKCFKIGAELVKEWVKGCQDGSSVVVFRSAKEEPAVLGGGGGDGGAFSSQCAAALGGDERVPPGSRSFGPRTRGDPVSAEPGQSWASAGVRTANTKNNELLFGRSECQQRVCVVGLPPYVGRHVPHRHPSPAPC